MTSPVRGEAGYPSIASTTPTHASSENFGSGSGVARGRRVQELGEVGREPREHDLALGVAEPDVVLDELRARSA